MGATTRILGLLATLACAGSAGLAAQVAVRGDVVHTMAGPAIEAGVVLVAENGRIERVGAADEVRIPEGYRVLEAAVVTPGLVDAHSVVGLAGYLNSDADQDQLERSEPIQPELRAFDAYNATEPLVAWLRGFGITTVHTGHGPGALVSGQTMVVKTVGENVSEALVDSVTMVAMTLGPDVSRNFGSKAGTRAKGVAMLRAELVKARHYRDRRARAEDGEGPARDLGLDVLVRVLEGEIPALITAQAVPEIQSALRLRDEFGFRLVLDGAAESHLLLDEIREAGVPVILHPPMARAGGTLENATMETARLLAEAGIPFALQSGFESYVPKTRVVLFEAGVAAGWGLPFEQALAAITRDAARILGVDDRVGTLEPGKDGDLALFDGDPFEYTTHVCAVVVRGRVVSETCR
ncbi:MAG: amidohydrolase family protein [Gemmatimonadetes bacterium]|nr:amidohydrolase family protein [Gemmatimonadota bacterium]NIQ59784.1 amidohydrolase family protein [Gemmatimonadota bacterium]NIU79989.1 amidohydrolase family protein [Gammaproteobacteria bacterium]NIX48435.1 amidohydrolase family protein [Gemmatimonadota bacterium]NIY12867.1 amidohydrolase family protein [Gemmatimonadota bacterium]